MTPINLDFGPDVVVKGAIFDTDNPAYLREDLLEIDLPSGLTISVGWEPHRDPDGSYHIRVFRGHWDDLHQNIDRRMKDREYLLRTLRYLVNQYHAPEREITRGASSPTISAAFTVTSPSCCVTC
ncbi:MAG: hypothetical protein WBC44_09905 [Planctomycetaceae bacterium]